MELLYSLTLLPIELVMQFILEWAFNHTQSYGYSLIILSIVVNIFLLPIYYQAENWRNQDKLIQAKMRSMIDNIKRNYKGKERHYYIQALYRLHGYTPVSSVKASAGFLIQIPFFFAAFHLLGNYEALNGSTFFIFQDLGQPDGLLFGINLLPFLMTVVNLVSAYTYIRNYDTKEKYQLWGMAILFLVILYIEPAGLLIYWTVNNVFSLFKNIVEKTFKQSFPLLKLKLNFNFLNINIENKTILYFSLFLITVSLSFFIPLHTVNSSDNGWDDFHLNWFLFVGFAYFLIFTIIGYSIILIVAKSYIKQTLLPLALFVLSWVVLSGFVFSIAESRSLVDPSDVKIEYINLLIVFLLSIAIFWVVQKKKNTQLPILFNLTIIIFALFPINNGLKNIASVSTTSKQKIIDNFINLSNRNIIVLSFDGIPNIVFQQVINDNLNHKKKFKDFIIFTEAFASAPATTASIVSSLFGNRNFRKKGNIGEGLDLTHELAALPMNNIKNSYTYESYSLFKINSQQRVPVNFSLEKKANLPIVKNSNYIIRLAIARVFTRYTNQILDSINLSDLVAHIALSFTSYNELDYLFLNYNNLEWKIAKTANKFDYDYFVENLNFDLMLGNEISLREMHFSHTHFPVDFDENCNLRSTSKKWADRNQNYNGLYNQTICVVKEFANLIEKLQKLGVYDNTLIILKSDHGEPPIYFHEIPNNYKINNHLLLGYNRYRPLLMIKDFNENNDSIKQDSSFVGLPDIPKTLCLRLNQTNCDQFPGVNLLSRQIKNEIEANPIIYLELGVDEKSDFQFDKLKTIPINRSRFCNLLDVFKAHPEVKLSIDTKKYFAQ